MAKRKEPSKLRFHERIDTIGERRKSVRYLIAHDARCVVGWYESVGMFPRAEGARYLFVTELLVLSVVGVLERPRDSDRPNNRKFNSYRRAIFN